MESQSDMEKQIDGEIIKDKEIPIEKEADLYNQELYTIVPANFDTMLDIFPSGQDVSHSSVLLWSSIKTIPPSVLEAGYKILKIRISDTVWRNFLKNLGQGVYSLKVIPKEWIIGQPDAITTDNN